MNKIFVNEFLTLGMDSFYQNTKENLFERHIVECLCDIYGIDKIRECYDSNNEIEFMETLKQYGLSARIYDNFLRDTNRYEKFRKSQKDNRDEKTNALSAVESSVITMFLYKCLLHAPSFSELSHFENDLLNDFAIIKLHYSVSLLPNKTRDLWEQKKKVLSENVKLTEIKPEYLDEFMYARFGVKIEDVKAMDPRMVKELNRYIETKLNKSEIQTSKKRKFKINGNTVLSSGNGYVDALIIATVAATELALGIIYWFLHL